MSLIELCQNGDLEGVKAALKRGVDVNTKGEGSQTGLMQAVKKNHNSVVALLLKTPNIDVNHKDDSEGCCALHRAVNIENNEVLKLLFAVPNIDVNIVSILGESALLHLVIDNNIEGLKLLLNVPDSDVNIVDNDCASAVHWAVYKDNIEALKLLLSHPSLTALTLNKRDTRYGFTVMHTVMWNKLKHLALLTADLRIDLDTTDKEGKSLEEVARWLFLVGFLLTPRQHKI